MSEKHFPCASKFFHAKAKFPVFSLSGKSKNQIPCFPCAVAPWCNTGFCLNCTLLALPNFLGKEITDKLSKITVVLDLVDLKLLREQPREHTFWSYHYLYLIKQVWSVKIHEITTNKKQTLSKGLPQACLINDVTTGSLGLFHNRSCLFCVLHNLALAVCCTTFWNQSFKLNLNCGNKFTAINTLQNIKMANTKPSRIAIVNEDRCKPTRCNLECKKICPVNKMGKRFESNYL